MSSERAVQPTRFTSVARSPARIRGPPRRYGCHAHHHARRGRHAAASRPGALCPHRCEGLGQVRGHEPDGLVQGPRHDHGRLQGRRSTARRPSSAPRPATPRPRPPPTRRTPASPPPCSCPRARSPWASSARPSRTTRQLLQVQGNFDDCLDIARDLADQLPGAPGQLGQPRPHRGPEDGRVRGRRGARRRTGLPHRPGRQRRQLHRVPPRLHAKSWRAARPRSCRACSASRPPAAHRSCSASA